MYPVLLCLLAFLTLYPVHARAVEIAPTMIARSGAGAAVAKGHVFLVGGINGSEFLPGTEIAPIQPDGGFGAWKDGSKLKMERGFTTSVAAGDWLYVLGGANGKNGINLLATAERAKIGADGTMGPWILEPGLMQTSRRGTVAVVYKDNIYAIGGYSGIFLPTVERTKIRADGSLGPWVYEQSEMNDARYIHGAAVHGNTLYAVGGHNEETGGAFNSVEYCKINPDGSLGPWKRASPLIESRYLNAAAVAGGYIYTFGGFNGKSYMQTVEKAKIKPDGSLGTWEKTASLTVPREGMAPVVHKDGIYLIGGSNSTGYLASTEYAKVGKSGEIAKWVASPMPHGGGQSAEGPAAKYAKMGLQLLDEGKTDDAIFAFQSALKEEKNLVDAYFYLGIAYLQKNRNKEAVDTLRQGVKLAPESSEMHYNLACAYSRQKQVKEGMASLKKALALGFDPVAAQKDPDLAYLKKDPGFKTLFNQKAPHGK